MRQQTILILDFGSQFSQLIARRVREAKVYCELVPGTTPWSELKERQPAGLILSGGPASVYDNDAPQVDPAALTSTVRRCSPSESRLRCLKGSTSSCPSG
jgi:GMP synthase (glutamine-hydrolysing)